MSDLICEVDVIRNIEAHPDVETTELAVATVKGWRSVIRKGSFQVGDPVVFIPPDAIVSIKFLDSVGATKYAAELPKSHELRNTHRRIKAARIRNEPSYGLLLKAGEVLPDDFAIGQSVIDILQITKWIPPVKVPPEDASDEDPLFHKYTKIQNYANYPDYLVEGEEVVVTEKIHGCLEKTTPISVKEGETWNNIQIQNIKIGDVVLSHNGEKYVEDIVLDVVIRGEHGKWLELEFDNEQTLRCTAEHLILTTDGWIEARNLNEEHTIL